MKNFVKVTLLSASLAALLLPVSAQTSTQQPQSPSASQSSSATQQPQSPSASQPSSATQQPSQNLNGYGRTINQRKDRQQARISQGLNSGQMTAGEAASVEKKESQLNQEERTMKSEDGGKLTSADKQALQQQQTQISNQIWKDKHNNVTQNPNPQSEVGKRADNQQDRIAQGIHSGQLTSGETQNLENREAAINHEVATDRAANGGKLTQAEKQQVNRQQNQVSKQIYKDKHNNNRRH